MRDALLAAPYERRDHAMGTGGRSVILPPWEMSTG